MFKQQSFRLRKILLIFRTELEKLTAINNTFKAASGKNKVKIETTIS
jgi:hypothetical protein